MSTARLVAILRERIRAEWRVKLLLALILPTVFCVGYFTLQRVVLFPVQTFRETPLDLAIPFEPAWVYVYQSIYLLMPIAPWLSTSRRELANYTKGLLILSAAGFLTFLLFPISCPRPDAVPQDGLYGLLATYDGRLNSFPSLHVGLTTYTFLFGLELLRPAPRRVRLAYVAVTGVWASLIFYSTLATKQHFAVDLPAGALLAIAAHAWAWRRSRRHITEGARHAPPSRHDDHSPRLPDAPLDAAGFGAAGGRPRAAPRAEGGV